MVEVKVVVMVKGIKRLGEQKAASRGQGYTRKVRPAPTRSEPQNELLPASSKSGLLRHRSNLPPSFWPLTLAIINFGNKSLLHDHRRYAPFSAHILCGL
jgi:hypothetical protein